jgi:hypothetical protein
MKQITTDDMDGNGAVEALVLYPDGTAEWKLERADEVYRNSGKFLDWRHTPEWVGEEESESYTADDFAYALAQLTDDCELDWVRKITGLSYDECEKIMRIAFAAQQRVFK